MVVKKLFQDVSLGEIFYINTKSINPGNTPNKKFWHYSIPAYDDNKEPTLDRGADIKSNKYLLETDSILVSKLNPRIKRVWKFQKSDRHEPSICSTEFMVYQPKIPNVDLEYYTQFFSSDIFQNKLLSLQNGTTGSRMRVTPSDTLSIPIPFPSINEQRKIAAILSSVDEAIEKTEAIIEQTEKVKKGLMQQLLTKGIGHTKFKKTEIGEIPEEWEVKRLSEISLINMGQSPSSAVCNDLGEGIPFFQGNAEFGMKHPIPKRWCTEPTKLANKGDILISVRAPVGELNIANQTCCIGRGLAAITPTKINNDYLYFAMQIYKSSLLKVSQGSTFTAINKQDLHNLLLPVPSLIEQKKISAILLSLDSKFEKEKKKLNQLQFMKTGLMQVLLTGKVRVKVDEDEVTSS